MKRILILLIFTLLSSWAKAERIQVEHINQQAGLAYSSVYSIYEDEHGFIWAATINGLNRYDGSSVRVFEPGNTKDLAENNIKMITGDQKGHLFIKGFEGLYLYNLRLDKFTLIKSSGVDVIYYDDKDLYYTSEGRVLRYDIATGKSVEVFSLRSVNESLHINALAVDSDGDFYVGTERDGFYVVNSRGEITRHLEYGLVRSIYIDDQENVWLSMNGQGLRVIDGVRGDVKEYRRREHLGEVALSSNFVREVQQIDSTHYYVATRSGLSVLDTTDGSFEPYTYDDCLLFNVPSLLTIMLDSHNTLWLGSYYEGLQFYNPKQSYQRYYLPGGDNMHHHVQMSYVVNNIVEGEDGRKWMATEGGGVIYIDEENDQIRSAEWNHKLFGPKVKAMYIEGDIMWVTSDDGICKVNTRSGDVVHIRTVITADDGSKIRCGDIISITKHDGKLYCGTNQGVLILDATNNSISMLDFNHLSEKRFHVWDILFDGDEMWITTSTDLYRYNSRSHQTNIYTRYMTNGGSNKHHFINALKDDDGHIWFTSSGMGIFLYDEDGDTFVNYGGEELLGNYVTGICKSPNEDRLILSTIKGISSFDIKTHQFENYNESNGFPFSAVSSSGLFISSDDELFALGINSVIRMPLSELRYKYYDSDIFFTSLMVEGEIMHPGAEGSVLDETTLYQREITLRAEHSSVTFNVRDNDYSAASVPNLEYQLEGFDRGFTQLSSSGKISYSSLSPGHYELVVRSKSPNEAGEVSQTSMSIWVRGNLIYSREFVIACICFIIFLFFVLYREWRKRLGVQGVLVAQSNEYQSIEQDNSLKFNLFTRLAHEFRTPLTLILAQLENILEQRNVAPAVYSKILSAYRSSQIMERLVGEIIDISRWEQSEIKLDLCPVDLNDYIENIYLSFEEYARGRGVNYRFEPSGKKINCEVDIIEFEKVINNLISNAFGYMVEGGELVVRLEAPANGETQAKIIIVNRDSYFSDEDLAHLFDRYYTPEVRGEKPRNGVGMGLAIVKDIVTSHSGQISVASTPGRGTTFVIVLDVSSKPVDQDAVVRADKYALSDEEMAALEKSFNKKPAYKAKIMIVEDNQDLRGVLERIFSTFYEVHTASDGAECLAFVKDIQPDIILSDVSMPNMFGTAMCAAIKSDNKTSHIPVILYSENSSEEAIIEGFIHGADDYIIKPFSTKLLVARCNSFIINRHRLRDRNSKADVVEGDDLTPQLITSNMEDLEMITKAEEVVKRHIGSTDFDAQAFATEMGLCRTYLFSKIKSVTGLTPNEFILNMRMKVGMQMIQDNPHITVTSLAYDCGFNSSSYFIRCFKALYGKTPNMCKKELLEAQRAAKK